VWEFHNVIQAAYIARPYSTHGKMSRHISKNWKYSFLAFEASVLINTEMIFSEREKML
jgi:hypothetical protein